MGRGNKMVRSFFGGYSEMGGLNDVLLKFKTHVSNVKTTVEVLEDSRRLMK